MARGSQGKGKTPRTETPSAPSPSDITMPIPSSTDPISQDCTNTGSQSSALIAPEPFELDTLESSVLAGPKNMKSDFTDSQGAQGLAISSFLNGSKPLAQATDGRQSSAKSKKRSKRKANKATAQGQGSQVPAISPDILPLYYCGPMPAPPIASPKLNVGSPSVSPRLAFAEPTKAEENLRQENEKLRQELEEASWLAKGLKESHLRLEEEVEAWKQKCEGFSEVVKELRTEVEEMINFRISKFFEIMEEEKGGKEQEEKEKERKKKEVEETERKEREGKENGRKEKERRNKGGKEKEGKEKKGKVGDRKEGKGKAEDVELKAMQVKSQKSYFDQMQDYRQRKKAEERRRKRWWNRFQTKLPRTSWRRVLITLFLLGLFILLVTPLVLIGTAEVRAYNRAHARRIARLKLTESLNVQLAKAVAQFVADLMPEPIRGVMYHRFLNDGWNLEELHW